MKTKTRLLLAVCLAGAFEAQADTWEYAPVVWGDVIVRHVDNGVDSLAGCPQEGEVPDLPVEFSITQSSTASKKRQFTISLGASHVDLPNTFPASLGWQSNWESTKSFSDTAKGGPAKPNEWHQAVVITCVCSEGDGTSRHTKKNIWGEEIARHDDVAHKHDGNISVRTTYELWWTPKKICKMHNIPATLPSYIGDSTCTNLPPP